MNTDQKFVITISRELGSGGRTIGRLLAEKLGVRYCDKDVIESLVKEFNLSIYEIERIKAKKKNKNAAHAKPKKKQIYLSVDWMSMK